MMVFTGNSFYGSTLDVFGAVKDLSKIEAPQGFGNGNVAFPPGWTRDMAAEWRRSNNIPGAEWPDDAEH